MTVKGQYIMPNVLHCVLTFNGINRLKCKVITNSIGKYIDIVRVANLFSVHLRTVSIYKHKLIIETDRTEKNTEFPI